MIPQPLIEREKLPIKWVHIGNGHFFRAHQIFFNDLAIQKAGHGWGCSAINLRNSEISQTLRVQKNIYTVATEKSRMTLGSLLESLHIKDDADLCFSRLLSPNTELISLTITEKGYLTNEPAMKLLAEVCEKRFASHGRGLVFLSCDNLQKNGETLKKALLKELSPAASAWVQENCFFPCCVVDRIVPHFSQTELQAKELGWGYFDPCAIFTEDFAQWIIEDNFGPHRPNWASAGVEFVKDVSPFEKIKLQVLNSSHSWLAYRGLLKGHEVVADCMQDHELVSELSEMIDREIAPSLEIPSGFSLAHYKESLFVRFKHPTMRHRLAQIAIDGTVKIPQRWVPVMSPKTPLLLKGLAAWLSYVQKHPYQDAQKDKLTVALKTQDFMTVLKEFKLLPLELTKDDQIKAILQKELQKL